MVRRRFFPSKPVQTAPGQTVQLEVQLRPEQKQAAVPSAASSSGYVCDVDGVAWFNDWLSYDGTHWSPEGYVLSAKTADMAEPDADQGVYWWSGGRLMGGYVEINSELTQIWRAVVLGRTLCDVQWTWSLNAPSLPGGSDSWWDGVSVTEVGGTLIVRVKPGGLATDGQWWSELTATATCGGTNIGALVLRPGFNLLNGSLPAIDTAGP